MRNSPHGTAGLAHELRRALTPTPFTSAPVQWGKVHAVHTGPNRVDLYLDGVTQRSTFTATKTLTKGVRFFSWYQPRVGDVVMVSRGTAASGTDRVVLGPLSGGTNTAPVRIGTAAGAPTTSVWIKGTQWLDTNGVLWICTASGTPGTWARTGVAGNPAGRMYPTATTTIINAQVQVGSMTTTFTKGGVVRTGNQLVVPVAGVYLVSCQITWEVTGLNPPPSGYYYQAIIMESTIGNLRAFTNDYTAAATSDTLPVAGGSDYISLPAGAKLQLQGKSAATVGVYAASSATWISLALVSQ